MADEPILLLDMDGPLADFNGHFYRRCIELGVEFDIDHPERQTFYFLTEHIPDRAQRALSRLLCDSAGWFAQLPVEPGAIEGVRGLLGTGLDIWVCTKPLEANPGCLSEKHAWLVQHFPELSDKLITAPDKSRILGHVLLDDAPSAAQVERATWTPVVFETVYNGEGSEWGHYPRWAWGDDPEEIYALAAEVAHRGQGLL